MTEKALVDDEVLMPFFHQLTDAGQFSLGALCAVSLHTLFEEDSNEKFKKDTLKLILKYTKQPKQVQESIQALLEGQGVESTDPYVDILLIEDAIKQAGNAEPLVTDLITMAIKEGCYDARLRVLIKHVTWQLRVSWDQLEEIEDVLAQTLVAAHYEMSEDENKEKIKKARNSRLKRYALIGLATVGGGTLIGLTGGLAAPLVAAGAGAIIGGAGAAALGTTAGVAIIGSLFGVAGAGLSGYKMRRRVGAVEEFMFEPLVSGNALQTEGISKQLHITIAITGWLSSKVTDFRQPWQSLAESKEQYSLKWESKYLIELGRSFEYVTGIAVSMAAQEALKYTVLSGILAAIAWPTTLISAANVIDNPWSVCLHRANNAGKQLAEVLLAREQGKRPVTLIGYSLGARVIFACLEELVHRKGSEGIIEDVILLGAPVSGDVKYWSPLTTVVAGKIVNGYCRGDWLLKFLYRTSSVQIRVAGLRPVKWDNRRMHNIDLSSVVSGHMDYERQLPTIMKAVGVRTRDEVKPKKPTTSQSAPITPTHSYQGLVEQRQTQSEPVSRSQTTQNISAENDHLATLNDKLDHLAVHSKNGAHTPDDVPESGLDSQVEVKDAIKKDIQAATPSGVTKKKEDQGAGFKNRQDVLQELSRSISDDSCGGVQAKKNA